MIAVVDYHKGNLLSVERGLRNVGADAQITDDPAVVAAADAIVLPGVGAFTDAALSMDELGLTQVLVDRVRAGVPFLGICLGMHLMFAEGTEDAVDGVNSKGLGLIPGVVDRIPAQDADGNVYKIPHVGWNEVEPVADCPLFEGISAGEYFYFTHSFIAPESDATVATTTHSVTFPCMVQFGTSAFGVQFHPEKSSDVGALMLKNFVDFAAANPAPAVAAPAVSAVSAVSAADPVQEA